MPKTIKNFLRDESGFEGAEKALLICVGLAIVLLVGGLIKTGSESAANKAKGILSSGGESGAAPAMGGQ